MSKSRGKKPGTRSIGFRWDWIRRSGSLLGVGPSVREIRIHVENEYRILYIAGFEDAFFILHAFVKKTQKTSRRDLDLAKKRFDLIM